MHFVKRKHIPNEYGNIQSISAMFGFSDLVFRISANNGMIYYALLTYGLIPFHEFVISDLIYCCCPSVLYFQKLKIHQYFYGKNTRRFLPIKLFSFLE